MASYNVQIDGQTYRVDNVNTPEEAEAQARSAIGPQPGDEGFEHDFDLLETAKNIPGSAWEFAKDVTYPIRHPVEFYGSMKNLGGAVLDATGRNFEEFVTGEDIPPSQREEILSKLGDYFVERYGGMEEIQKSIQEDPVGMFSDAMAVITGGATAAARLPGKVGQVSSKVARTASSAEPVTAVTSAIGAAARRAPGNPRGWYESAVKFPPKMKEKDRNLAIDTGLKEGILPTGGGKQKRIDLEAEWVQKLDDLLEEYADKGIEVPAGVIHRAIGEFRDSRRAGMGAEDALNTIDAVEDKWRAYMDRVGKDSLTLRELQDFKTSTYGDINFRRPDASRDPVKEEVFKAGARGARESLEGHIPGIKEINDELAGLYALEDPLTGAANRTGNLNMLGLGTKVAAGTGATAAVAGLPLPYAIALAGAGIALDNPKVKAGVAIIYNKMKQNDVKWLKENMKIPAVSMVVTQIGRIMDDQDKPLQVEIKDGVAQ